LDHGIHQKHITFFQARLMAEMDLSPIVAPELHVAHGGMHKMADYPARNAPHQIGGKNERIVEHHHHVTVRSA
jgi:hypothetical protein